MTNGPGRDGAGNIVNDGNYRYVYDLDGRICAVENLLTTAATQYVYDAEGNRVGRGTLNNFPAVGATCPAPTAANGFTLTTTWLRGASGAQDAEIDWSAGSVTGWHQNVFSGSELLATYTAAGITFHLNDWLGTRRVDLNSSGQVVQAWYSNPWGAYLTTLNSSADTTNQHFTGQEHDSETGNDYFKARYYGSSTGRMLSPDPSGLVFADQTNPQSFNLYAYVRNNPLSFTDPKGLYCAWEDGTSDDDPKDGGVSKGQCNKQGGHWTDSNNPCHGMDGCVSTFDWNDPNRDKTPTYTPNPWIEGVPGALPPRITVTQTVDPDQANRNALAQGILQLTGWIPDVCSGGTYTYGGKGASGGVAHAFQGVIINHDSDTGTSVGLMTEVGGGEEIVGSGGVIQNADGTNELIGFAGVGADAGIAGASTGLMLSPGSIGLNVESQVGGVVYGGGAYVNISTMGACARKAR